MAMPDFSILAFDADDTLWDNQSHYDRAEEVFVSVLHEYGSPEELSDRLFEEESGNMDVLGYGAKAVCISMMEAAIRISGGKVSATQLSVILSQAKGLLRLPATPLPGVLETLRALRERNRYRMILLTKGDMLDQRNKLRRSGLEPFFDRMRIVTDKTPDVYRELCREEGIEPSGLLMVGNSFKSDILPVVEIGGYGIHIPFHTLWRHEVTDEFPHPRVQRAQSFSEILELIK